MLTKPNWQENYKDFPEIPDVKKWPGESLTQEQIITKKLIDNEAITKDEENKLSEVIRFYNSLSAKLKTFDFASLDDKDIENFKNYFHYAFNYNVLITNQLDITRTFRVVLNEKVLGERKRIRYRSFLGYPSLEIVKKFGNYNRANSPSSNVFYGSETIDTALRELKPKPGDLVTVGVWKPITNKPLISYPITHNPASLQVNQGARKGYFAFQEMTKNNHPLLTGFMNNFFSLLSHEYSKPVQNPKEYLISSFLSEQIFKTNDTGDFNYGCIVYPSVGNDYTFDNVAILPDIIDKEFKLEKAIEFEVTKTDYDKLPNATDPDLITLLEYRNREETDWIMDDDGYIVW